MELVPVELHDKILRAAYLLHGQYAQDYHRMGVLSREHRAFLQEFEELYNYDFDNHMPCANALLTAEQHWHYLKCWELWKDWKTYTPGRVLDDRTSRIRLRNVAKAAVFNEPCKKPSELKALFRTDLYYFSDRGQRFNL